MLWTVPEMWADQTVYIIGGGPSVKGMDLRPIHSRPVLGVNQAFELGHWVDITYFGDEGWWTYNWKEVVLHPGLICTSVPVSLFEMIDRVKQIKRAHRYGLWTKTKDRLCWNASSGASAINLALHLGAAKVVLIGYDMKIDKNKNHNWHDKHIRRNPQGPLSTIYENTFIPPFQRMKEALDLYNQTAVRPMEIINATPGSALTIFPMIPLEATFE